jgi:hypothetical protein
MNIPKSLVALGTLLILAPYCLLLALFWLNGRDAASPKTIDAPTCIVRVVK